MASAFANKVVFITGGASGIGKATAMAFASQGARVVIADVSDKLESVAQELMSAGHEAMSLHMDVAQKANVQAGIEEVIDTWGHIDIAFNNAGIGGAEALTKDYPDDVWDQVIAVNLTGVFHCMSLQLAHMVERRQGVIVNTASVAGVLAFPWHAAYAASKHGVIGLTKSAAAEAAQYGVRVNAICPGFTYTPMVDEMLAAKPGREQKMQRAIPIKRLAQPEEIAAGVLYLASKENQFMIGHTLMLDGGASII